MLNRLLLRESLAKFAAAGLGDLTDTTETTPAPATSKPTAPAAIPNPYHAPKTISPATIPATSAVQPTAAPAPKLSPYWLPSAIRENPAMDKLQNRLHGGSIVDDPRAKMIKAIQEQSPGGQIATYQSAAGRALLDRRQLSQNRPLPQEPPQYSGAHARGGRAHVPASMDSVHVGSKDFYEGLGYNAIANHEMEHAHDQQVLPDWVADQSSAVLRAKWKMDFERSIADVWTRPAVPKSLPSKYYNLELERHLDKQRIADKAQAAHAAATKTYEDSGAKGGMESRRPQYPEIGPSIGDLVFRSEQFAKEHGKPLEHAVQFPSGKSHDINWMRQQAQQHGYWDGQSMDSLLMDNSAGQQWLRDAAGSGQMEKQNSAAKADDASVKQSEPQVRVDPKVDAEIGSAMSALGKPVTASRKILFRGSGSGKIMPIPHREATKNYSVRKQSNDPRSLLPVIESLRWRAENSGTVTAVKRADAAKTAATAIIALLRIR